MTAKTVDRVTRPRFGPWLDEEGNVRCEACTEVVDPDADRDAPWCEVRFTGGVRLEVWHERCNSRRVNQLDL